MKPIVFFSYAHADIEDVASIKSMLDELQRDDKIALFHDSEIRSGERFDAVIAGHLHSATHFLLGISDDYIKSAYIRAKELPLIKSKVQAGGLKAFPLLIKGLDWLHFLEGDRANFLSRSHFWPIVDGRRIPLNDLPVHQRAEQILKLRKDILKKNGPPPEPPDPDFWAANRDRIRARLEAIQMTDFVDLRTVAVQLPTYLAECIEVDAIADLVSEANEILYGIDQTGFPKHRIADPPANLSPDEEEDYWSGVFVSLSQRSPLAIVTLLALIYPQAPSVRGSIERIIDASEKGATP
jgi:TIR domain-containing protein